MLKPGLEFLRKCLKDLGLDMVELRTIFHTTKKACCIAERDRGWRGGDHGLCFRLV